MLESRDSSPNWHTEMFTSQLGDALWRGEDRGWEGVGYVTAC